MAITDLRFICFKEMKYYSVFLDSSWKRKSDSQIMSKGNIVVVGMTYLWIKFVICDFKRLFK